jgi:cytoskeleton-associated protein 5
LKARVGDTNKACQILALDILSRIASGMNKPFERYARLYIAPIAMVLSDQKPNIRAAATKTLSDFAIACEGMEPLVGGIATGLESQNPLQRSSLLSWIAEWLSTHPPSATLDLSPWVSSVVACLDDRSADVRKAAQAVLPHLIRSVGFDRVVQETGSLKPATRAAIMPHIQAARPEAGEQPSGPKPQRPKSPPPQTQIPAEVGPGPSRPTGLRNKKLNVTGDASTKPELPRAGSRAGPTSASGSVASTPNPPASPTADTRIFMASSTEAKKARLLKDSGKWIIEAAPVRKDLLELLHHQMEGHVARSVLSLLFSTDHNAVNDYMAGMTQLSNCFTDATSKMDESVSLALVSNCDLVLKYACTKVHESQPNLISRSLELLHSVVDFLRNVDYQLSDGEAQLFIPTIIHKVVASLES